MDPLRDRRSELSPLTDWKLEHGNGAAVTDEAARRHRGAHSHRSAATVEEDQVEGEAHAEGVDARAAGDQQPRPGRGPVQAGEPEQARAQARRDRDEAAADTATRQPEQAVRDHADSSRRRGPFLPAGCNPPFRHRLSRARAYDDRQDRGPAPAGLAGSDWLQLMDKKTTRRGNYESGSDYVLEYGELRFAFNEDDFGQRVEQAAVKLDFVDQGLVGDELNDLLELAVNGEIREPTSSLGEHINEHWTELVGPASRSLVHWIRRLVFRGAWLDQRVKEGELDIVFDADTQSFGYVQPERDSEPIELSREPSWARLAYRR